MWLSLSLEFWWYLLQDDVELYDYPTNSLLKVFQNI